MASITIRNLDEPLKKRLRNRAAEHGRSMEGEAREILRPIAAIARAHGAAITTRNTPDFDGCGVAVMDPWTAL